MKKGWFIGILIGWICLGGGLAASAQTFAEWFKQTKTRIKYYEQQIAAQQVYIGYLENGYQLVEGGLNTIRGIKNGEFDLHNSFYNSLESINPQIANMAEVAEIISLQIAIIKKFSGSLAAYRKNKYLSGAELGFISAVYSNVLTAGQNDVNALLAILTANTLKMTDDQRIARIRALDTDMRDQYAFTSSFTGRTDLLCAQRQAAGSDIGSVKQNYGL